MSAAWPWFWLVLDCVAVAVSVLALRASYRRIKEPGIFHKRFALEGDEGDAMTHLVVIDIVRQNGHRIPRETPRFMLAGELDYPALYHKLLSYIPRRWLERGEWLISPFFEGVHAALIYLAAWWVFSEHLRSSDPRALALLVVAGWALTPLLVFNPRRGSMIGERCFGYLFTDAFLFASAMLIATDNAWWLVLAVPAMACTMGSSKFGLQAVVFVGGLMAVLAQSLWPVLALALGASFAVAVTFGYVLRVVAGSVNHSWVYLTFLSRVHAYTIGFSHRNLVQATRALIAGRLDEARAEWMKHPLRLVVTWNPWIVAPGLIAAHAAVAPAAPFADILLAWSFASFAVAIATMTDWLKFLGEGERYLEVGLFPMIALAMALDSPVQPLLVFAALAYGLWCLLGVYTAPGPVTTSSPEMLGLIDWLREQPVMTLFPIPGRMTFPIAYQTPHRFVWLLINVPRGMRLDSWKALFSNGAVYPYAAPEQLAKAKATYGADAFVVDKRSCATAAEAWSLRYDFSGLPILYENARYAVIGARPAAMGRTEQDAA